jgi:DNA-binding ferritin-like protein
MTSIKKNDCQKKKVVNLNSKITRVKGKNNKITKKISSQSELARQTRDQGHENQCHTILIEINKNNLIFSKLNIE